MYVPRAFREQRTDVLHATMRDIGVAAIVGQGGDGLAATHAPIGNDALEERSEVQCGSLAIPRRRQSWYRHA